MATNVVDISQVKPDIDEMAVGIVKNPFLEDFTHPYAGRPLTIPAGKEQKAFRFVEVEEKDKNGKVVKKKKKEEYTKIIAGKKQFPLYVAVHLAKHLAEKIIRAEHRKYIEGIKDDKKRDIEAAKPIPDYKGKIWRKMKELVETDSDFFNEKDEFGKTNEEKFTK